MHVSEIICGPTAGKLARAMSSSFVAALYPSFSFCYKHSLNDLNPIRCMTSITILWAVIIRLYYRSTRTPEIEPADTMPISIRRSDRPPSPNLLPMRVMLPSSQRHCPRQFLICFHTISSRPSFLLIWTDLVRGCRWC